MPRVTTLLKLLAAPAVNVKTPRRRRARGPPFSYFKPSMPCHIPIPKPPSFPRTSGTLEQIHSRRPFSKQRHVLIAIETPLKPPAFWQRSNRSQPQLRIPRALHSASRARLSYTYIKTSSQASSPGSRRWRTRTAGFPLAGPTVVATAPSSISSISSTSTTTTTMSSKLIPANPSETMVIRNVTPNVVTLSVPFLRFGRLPIGGRGTIVKLTSGALAVFSPVALTPEVKAKVREMGGSVAYLVALDIEHHIFLSEWATEYPGAKLIGPEGLPEKRLKMTDDKIGKEPFAVVFEGKTKREIKISAEFDRDFEYEYVDSHPNKEIVFFYKPDRVLIEADLLFNLPAKEQYSRVPDAEKPKMGALGNFFASLQTTQGEAKGAKRFMWYVMSRGNRAGWNESMKRIDTWDFVTLIPCHGETLEGNGKEAFEKIFEWHLKAEK